jgi:hypothetical protein
MIGFKELKANPRRRALLGLLPLSVVMIVITRNAWTDESGPRHGIIPRILAAVGIVSLAMLVLGVLKATKRPTGT